MHDLLSKLVGWETLIGGCDNETVFIAFLSSTGDQLAHRVIPGSIAAVHLPVRTLVSQALDMDAATIFLAHNHPSGNPKPSRKDIVQTHALERLLFSLSITIEDHMIIAGDQHFSFRAEGLL